MNELKIYVWLTIISIISFVVYVLKSLNAEELSQKPKGYLYRKIIIGGIGNVIIVVTTFHLLKYVTSMDDTLILCGCCALGYIGADSIFKIVESALEKYFLNKADKL